MLILAYRIIYPENQERYHCEVINNQAQGFSFDNIDELVKYVKQKVDILIQAQPKNQETIKLSFSLSYDIGFSEFGYPYGCMPLTRKETEEFWRKYIIELTNSDLIFKAMFSDQKPNPK